MLQSIKRKCKLPNFARTRKQAEKPPRRTQMYFKASLLLLFGWREATIGNTSAFEGYKALNSRVSVRVPSHVTSHHIPEMESLLAHLSVSRL